MTKITRLPGIWKQYDDGAWWTGYMYSDGTFVKLELISSLANHR